METQKQPRPGRPRMQDPKTSPKEQDEDTVSPAFPLQIAI